MVAVKGPDAPTSWARPIVRAASRLDRRSPWALLFLRQALLFGLQAICAALFLAAASPDPWRNAADWWLAWFALASVINLIVLRTLLRREDIDLRDFYRGRARGAHREVGSDLRWVGIALVYAAPLGIIPNLVLSSALWGGTTAGGALSFRPLPVFGAVAILLVFPIVHALAELPTYFGYVMPRLASANGWRIQAVVVCAAVLSVQHVFHRRPTTLPYLVVAHALLDLSLPIAVLMLSLT